MRFEEFFESSVKLIELKTHEDHRGFFMQCYDERVQEICGFEVKQENISISKKNVLRGMHYQWDEPMSKLVQCVRGKVVDFVLDIRKGSKTFGESMSFILDKPNKLLSVPAGFAHGFISLDEETIVKYHCSCYYNKEGEGSINFFDNEINLKTMLNIQENDVIISKRDMQAITFFDYIKQPKF